MGVTVGTVVGLIAEGRARDETLREYPYLEPEGIAGCARNISPGFGLLSWAHISCRYRAGHCQERTVSSLVASFVSPKALPIRME
jgi:hypothetical protein